MDEAGDLKVHVNGHHTLLLHQVRARSMIFLGSIEKTYCFLIAI
jgi:hypothetical protein